MGIGGDLYPFMQKNVNAAPADSGVYKLYDGNETIYIGRASGSGVTIRSRLQSHYRGDEGACTQGATHYRREVTDYPITREEELQKEHMAIHGRLPRCNNRLG